MLTKKGKHFDLFWTHRYLSSVLSKTFVILKWLYVLFLVLFLFVCCLAFVVVLFFPVMQRYNVHL